MKRSFRQAMFSAMELPEELAQGAAFVEVTGQHTVRIEHYRKILEFTDRRLLLQCKDCRLELTGSGFCIRSYNGEELLLDGLIDQVHYC
ncbi:MAG: YabP/YqfC family sporulation protein [Eubacteriales bacterium]|nr:YabP/YqfC family sporulation protein [Eubacteriales bacterium]